MYFLLKILEGGYLFILSSLCIALSFLLIDNTWGATGVCLLNIAILVIAYLSTIDALTSRYITAHIVMLSSIVLSILFVVTTTMFDNSSGRDWHKDVGYGLSIYGFLFLTYISIFNHKFNKSTTKKRTL